MKIVNACRRLVVPIRPFLPSRRVLPTRALLQTAPGTSVKWSQDVSEVIVTIPVDKSITKKNIKLTIDEERINLVIDNQPVLFGSLTDIAKINPEESHWFMDYMKETETSKCFTLVLVKRSIGFESFSHLIEGDMVDTAITDMVKVSYEIDKKAAGVIVFGLFGKAAPDTVELFLDLGERSDQEMLASVFTKILPGQFAEFGIPGTFKPGNEKITPIAQSVIKARSLLGLKHERFGLLSVETQKSVTKFAVTFGPVPEFDTTRIVFGKVLVGEDVLTRIEAQGDELTGEPTSAIVMTEWKRVTEKDLNLIDMEEQKRKIEEIDM